MDTRMTGAKRNRLLFLAGGLAVAGFLGGTVQAHKNEHTKEQLKAYNEVFMAKVRLGDKLFHGDAEAQKKLGVKLSNTGMACAMCHPFTSDTHPAEFPKFQEQIGEFATLREMINWCIEKPNQGERIEPNSEAMKALEAYIYWSNKGSPLAAGTH